MMNKFAQHTLGDFVKAVAQKSPVPGGGSASALTAAVGTALISMVANYSMGRGNSRGVESRLKTILRSSERIRRRLLLLVDKDAQAYLGVVKARKSSDRIKQKALEKAAAVPMEVCELCYAAIQVTPYLVTHGNKYLLSDIEVAIELLQASFRSALINVRVNR